MWWCPWSHCCSMASLWSSADCACMACSWCAADIGGGSPAGRSRGYGVPAENTQRLISQSNGQRALEMEMFLLWESYRKPGAAASRVRVEVVRAAGWEWLRVGTGSGRGVVLQLEGLQVGVPQNLGDTQDIHHHLFRVSSFLSWYIVNTYSIYNKHTNTHTTDSNDIQHHA